MSISTRSRAATSLPRAGGRRVPFVLITGGKGGVGKSVVAANVSIELARSGLRVLLMDLDLGLANLNVLLRLSSTRNVEDALAGRIAIEECVAEGPLGLHVLPAGSGTAAMGRGDDERRARLLALIAELSARYDIVVGDSAAGIGPDVLAFAAAADHVLLVTTPEPTALTDAYGLIKALHTFGEETESEIPTPEVVINRAATLEEAEQTASKLRTVCERFLARSPKSAGWIPASVLIARSAAQQRPFALEDAHESVGAMSTQATSATSRASRTAGTSSTDGAPTAGRPRTLTARRNVHELGSSASGASLARGCLIRLAARIARLCPRAGAQGDPGHVR